jgi:uncharacterized OsmC-like protein
MRYTKLRILLPLLCCNLSKGFNPTFSKLLQPLVVVRHLQPLVVVRHAHARSVTGVYDISSGEDISINISKSGSSTLICSEMSEALPSPKELLYCALSSCTVATIRKFYANSKRMSSSWKSTTLEEIEVHVEEVMSAHEEHIPQKVLLTIGLKGANLSDEVKARLVQSSSFCPVKRMLSKELTIETILQ